MLVDDGQLVGALLLETLPDGTVTKLELTTAAGLLTVHPEGSTLHGNVARPGGMEHVALPWSAGHVLIVVGTPATAAAAACVLEPRIGVGEGHTVPGASIGSGLAVTPATFRVARVADRRWHMLDAGSGARLTVDLDADGVAILAGAVSWPLELHDEA
jgi:hypothetical protein